MTQELPPNPDSPETPMPPDAEAAEGSVALAAPPAPAAPAGLDDAALRRALEGLLFITDRPLSAAELSKIVGVKDQERITGLVEDVRRELEERQAGFRVIAVAEGWQMATRPELSVYMRKLFADRATMRLSTASQETLSIISYRQPLTRAEIEQIRGVEVIAALESLLEKRLIKVVGRKESVGRPLLYGTTAEFLRHFGLRSLEDLPPLDSFTPPENPNPERTLAGEASVAPDVAVDAAPVAEDAAPVAEDAAPVADLSTDISRENSADSPVEVQPEPVEAAVEETKSEDVPADETAGEDSIWPK